MTGNRAPLHARLGNGLPGSLHLQWAGALGILGISKGIKFPLTNYHFVRIGDLWLGRCAYLLIYFIAKHVVFVF